MEEKEPKTRVLMVCLGNICRSPLAEGILKNLVDPDTVEVDSAGTAGYHVGNPPDVRSIAVARKNGIDISSQRCRRFRKEDFEEFDFIYAMDRSNLREIHRMAVREGDRKKASLLLEEVALEVREVPDPYYGGARGFDEVYYLIEQACRAISKKLNPQSMNR